MSGVSLLARLDVPAKHRSFKINQPVVSHGAAARRKVVTSRAAVIASGQRVHVIHIIQLQRARARCANGSVLNRGSALAADCGRRNRQRMRQLKQRKDATCKMKDALEVAKYLGAKGAAGGLGVRPSVATSPASSSVARTRRAAAAAAPLERGPTGAKARHRAAALREPRAACAISALLGRQRKQAARACVLEAERSQPRLRAADSARPRDPRRAYDASGSVFQGGARAAHVPNARATREQWGAQQRRSEPRGLRRCAAPPARKCTRARSHTALERARCVNIASRALFTPAKGAAPEPACRRVLRPSTQTTSVDFEVCTRCVSISETESEGHSCLPLL